MARSINAVRYLECSAKHNRGVRECFDQAARVSLSGNYIAFKYRENKDLATDTEILQ